MTFCLSAAFFAFALDGVLLLCDPVPVRLKSDRPSSKAFRGVATTRAIFDLGESRWFLVVDRARCAVRFPEYTDLDAARSPSLPDFSGVNGEEFRFTGMAR